MPSPKRCCNPLNKSNHARVYKNLLLVTSNWNPIFSYLIGRLICNSCKAAIYDKKVIVSGIDEYVASVQQSKIIDPGVFEDKTGCDSVGQESESNDGPKSEPDDEQKDPTIHKKIHEKQVILNKMNNILYTRDKPQRASKKLKVSHSVDIEEVETLVNMVDQAKNGVSDCRLDENLVRDINDALSKAESRAEKIEILTTLPVGITIPNVTKKFNGVSRRMASQALKLRKNNGYKSRPKKKRGRPLPKDTLQQIKEFYRTDEISRMMPGRKDFVSIKTDVSREKVQKRLLLHPIKDIHSLFLKKFPEIKISCSAFSKLRPKECISVNNNKSFHNVCICKIHQNMRLKFFALKSAFLKKNVSYNYSYHDALDKIICETPSSQCYFKSCKNCPGTDKFCDKLLELLRDHSIDNINYMEWIKTDRYRVIFFYICIGC